MNLLQAIAERPRLADGAMGTQLQDAGLEPGGCGEAWNIDEPERVYELEIEGVDLPAMTQGVPTSPAPALMVSAPALP